MPRSINTRLTTYVFRVSYSLFSLRLRKATTYEDRDRIMALFAPATLFTLPLVWVALIVIGYMFMYWAIEPQSLLDEFKLSGSSLLTLGFAVNDNPIMLLLTFTQAAIGLTVVALLIAYLPTMYSAFSRRELAVSMLEFRAGNPPSPVTMITRYFLNDSSGVNSLGLTWQTWEQWFADIDESHTSLAPLVFFRSPQPGRSWVTAAGIVLDSAALVEATIDKPMDIRARLCIRAGFVALRHICDYFHISYNPDPQPTDPISIQQSEFDEVFDAIKAAGLPVVADREQAWRDYAGWRVNYDVPILALAELTMAPYAQWISDRGLPRQRRKGLRLFNTATEWKNPNEPTTTTH